MIFRRRHIILAAFVAVMSFSFYAVLRMVYKDTIEMNYYVKAFDNTELQLFYQADRSAFTVDMSHNHLLNASQFFANLPFLVPDHAHTKHLRLDFGDDANTIIMDRLELVVKSVGKRDTVHIWKGKELLQLIEAPNDMVVEAANISFIRLKAGSNDPYLVLNDTVFRTLERYYRTSATDDKQRLYLICSAILLAAMVGASANYILGRMYIPSARDIFVEGYAFNLAAAAVIFLVFANNGLGFLPDLESREKRSLKTRPELGAENFFEFPDLFSDFARDNFSFRNFLFYVSANLKVRFFNESPLPKDVIIGHNKWMFDNEKGCIEDFRNIAQVSQEELAFMTNNLVQRKAWLQKKNIRFYIIVPPNKNRIYPELMPAAYFQTDHIGHNRLDLYKLHLRNHAGINLIDPSDSLWSAKRRKEVYYNTDTHWNLFGGFKGYQVLAREISKDFPEVVPMKEEEFLIDSFYNNQGDLATMISLHDIYLRKEYSFLFKDPGKTLPGLDRSDIVIRFIDNKTIGGSQLKLLMFRDSYANYLIPFLNMHFKDATYVWSYEFLDKLIEEEQPDVVILESLQRFMPGAFLTPNPVLN